MDFKEIRRADRIAEMVHDNRVSRGVQSIGAVTCREEHGYLDILTGEYIPREVKCPVCGAAV